MEKQAITQRRKLATKKLFILLFVAIYGIIQAQTNYYFWNNSTSDNDFQTSSNWMIATSNNSAAAVGTTSIPSGTNDVAVFDGGLTNTDCFLFNSIGSPLAQIILNPSYTGTLDASNIFDLQAGSLSISGGAFISPLDSIYLSGTGGTILGLNQTGRLMITQNSILSVAGNFVKNGASTSLVVDNAMIRLGANFTNASGSLSAVNASICFSGSGAQSITGNGAALSIKNLKVNNTGTKTLSQTNAMTVSDVVEVSSGTLNANGKLILSAANNKTARIAAITSGSITGNVTAHNFIASRPTRWSILGAGGVAGQTIGTWNGSGTQQFPITCSDCLYTPSQASGFASIQGWDETVALASGFNTVVSTSDGLSPGKGYWVYLGNTAPATTSGSFDITYTGPVVQGSLTVGITNSNNSWNLIANPYASPLSSSAFLAANTLSGAAVYVWDGSTYVTNPSDIQAGQAFYVQASASGNVSFTESMKSSANTSNILARPGSVTSSNQAGFDLELRSGDYTDKTSVGINSNATQNYDPQFDAHKLYSSLNYSGNSDKYTSIATLSDDGDTCVINTMPVLMDSISIPLIPRVATTGSYTLGINNTNNMNSCVMLFDKLTGQYHDLKSSDYVCNISDTLSSLRFNLLLCRDFQVVSVRELNASSSIFITQNENGAIVKTRFEQTSTAVISAYNIMGQKLMNDIKVEGINTTTYLNLNANNQVVLIRVASDSEVVTKKIVAH